MRVPAVHRWAPRLRLHRRALAPSLRRPASRSCSRGTTTAGGTGSAVVPPGPGSWFGPGTALARAGRMRPSVGSSTPSCALSEVHERVGFDRADRLQQFLHGQVLDLVEANGALGEHSGLRLAHDGVGRFVHGRNLGAVTIIRFSASSVTDRYCRSPTLGIDEGTHQFVDLCGPDIRELIGLGDQTERFVQGLDQFFHLLHGRLRSDHQ